MDLDVEIPEVVLVRDRADARHPVATLISDALAAKRGVGERPLRLSEEALGLLNDPLWQRHDARCGSRGRH